MKKQDLEKVHNQSIPELKAEIMKLEKEMVELRIQKNLGQLKNMRQIATVRDTVARMKTIIRAKELSGSQA